MVIPTRRGILEQMPFGQYKGELIGTVMESDPGYIHWCLQNVALGLDDDALAYLEECLR